jgi:peptide/nickel transport system substrate-binding protein
VPQSRQLDPGHSASILAAFLSNERLTSNGPDGRVAPKLLERWSVSPDGLTWRLSLRPGVVFQDGVPLTSAEVKRELDTALADRVFRAIAVGLSSIVEVRTEGDLDLVVRLDRRCSYLLDDLDFPMTRPGPSESRIGTGPYAPVSASRDEIVMQANERYYLGAPAIKRIVIRPYDTLRTAWAEMLRGRVDFLSEISPDAVEFVSDQSAVRVHSFLSSYVYAIAFNSNRPVVRDPRVRRALSLAVDREALLQQGLRGRGIPARGPIWPRHWITDALAPPLEHDIAAAGSLLDAALGKAAGASAGGRAEPRARFTCLIPLNFSIDERLALLVQQQLWDVNVDMKLEAVSADVFNRRILAGDFDAASVHMLGGPYMSIVDRFWHSPDPAKRWNFWGYRDAEVDRALDQLRAAPSDEASRGAMLRFDRAQQRNPPALFLVWSETSQSISRRFDIPIEAGRDAFSGLSRAVPRRLAEVVR